MSSSDINKGIVETAPATATGKSTKSSLVELRNGKVIFKQKCTSFEKQSETLQEIVKFREMLEQRIANRAPPLIAIPDEHRPLIAKLVHESDKTLSALVKHVHRELLPTQEDGEDGDASSSSASLALSLNVVEAAIKAIVARNNYGLDGIPGGGKPPAAVCVWRWEVKEQHRDWLPKIARAKAETRLAERAQAKKDLTAQFEALSQEERDVILDPKGTGKLPPKETSTINSTNDPFTNGLIADAVHCSSHNSKTKKSEDEEIDQSENSPGKVSRPKKQTDPEKAAKEKEKLEKKVAKAEREKKEKDAQNKSRSLMAKFFGKAKGGIARAPYKDADSAEAGPSSSQSDFERTFKPFVLKKDADLAPVNWFLEENHRKRTRGKWFRPERDVIVIDDDEEVGGADVQRQNVQEMDADISQLSAKDRLRSIISSLLSSVDRSRLRRPSPSGLKTYSPLAVRDILSQLSEAEIAGDISVVRSLLSKLHDRTLLPAKVVIFADDARPGYFGTWTRSSRIIGPRRPFARDILVFDYGYDSGEEWEEEAAGEADDVVDDGDEEDADAEDPDSDLDSWLVDDDDVQEPGTPLGERAASPSLPDFPVPASALKRKAEEGERKLAKKRKVVVPLMPFAKGPCWESTVGRCEYDTFKPYRIQLFNDTPFPIDPFTFVSNPVEEKYLTTKNVAPSHAVFAVPSLPDRLALPHQTPKPFSSTGGSLPSAPAPVLGAIKRTVSIPKTSFPDAYLPFLLTKISSLQAASMTFLVEAIYQELRVHKVKKNAIEAKVKEVGEKCKEKKVWVIKQGVQIPRPLVQP